MKQYADNYEAAGFGREYAWLDLANTIEWDGFGKVTDHLDDPSWLAKILKHWNIASGVPKPIPINRLLALRNLLRRLAQKLHDKGRIGEADVKALNSYLSVPVRMKMTQRKNGVETEIAPVNPGWDWMLSRFVVSFGEMLALNQPDRLKYCPNEGCKWIFYDQTKGNTRRWCNDRSCGNRDRVRRARERARNKKKQRSR
jgi:predicted RNA-binding Zn ribbon-like protein